MRLLCRCRAVPAARPLGLGAVMRSRLKMGSMDMAITTPATMVSTAGSEGMPPIVWETPIAIGAVSDFGAIEMAMVCVPPQRRTRP